MYWNLACLALSMECLHTLQGTCTLFQKLNSKVNLVGEFQKLNCQVILVGEWEESLASQTVDIEKVRPEERKEV